MSRDEDKTKHLRLTFDPALDCLPEYETATLLIGGFCHIVRYDDHKIQARLRAKLMNAASLDKRRENMKKHLRKNFATIRAMLKVNATNKVISEAIGVSENTVIRRIWESPTLRKLSDARPGYGKSCPAKRDKKPDKTEAT